jgi:nicotinate-nucleotide adenylyltransferase
MRPAVGILGGTFDPVHVAHLQIAERAQALLELERVYFLVSHAPPHKPAAATSAWHRYAMVALATAHRPDWVPCPLELEVAGPSYTIDTLARFGTALGVPAATLVFIAGGDSLRDFRLWREWERLLAEYRFLFVARPGVDLGDAAAALLAGGRVADARRWPPERIRQALGGDARAVLADLDMPDVSSTATRHVLQSGQDRPELVPEPVRRYIQKAGLYGG